MPDVSYTLVQSPTTTLVSNSTRVPSLALDLENPHQIIILLISIVAFLLISTLIWTTFRGTSSQGSQRKAIPRHPVITTLLLTALPRIVVLLLPFLVEDSLRKGVPYHMVDRFDAQQKGPIANFCVAQGITAIYLLGAHAAFIVSFTLSLLHVLKHPESNIILSNNPPPLSTPLNNNRRLTFSSPNRKRKSKLFNWISCLFPLLFPLPIPILGLALLYTTPIEEHIIYFQGTYCSLDVYAFQLGSSLIVGIPMILSLFLGLWALGRLAFFYWRNWYYPATSVKNQGEKPTEKRKRRKRRLPLHLPLPLILRLSLLMSAILISTVLFLLEVSLSGHQLEIVLNVDRYWEAIVPLLEFLIFASQTAVLEAWFPSFFTRRLECGDMEPKTPDLEWGSMDESIEREPELEKRPFSAHESVMGIESGVYPQILRTPPATLKLPGSHRPHLSPGLLPPLEFGLSMQSYDDHQTPTTSYSTEIGVPTRAVGNSQTTSSSPYDDHASTLVDQQVNDNVNGLRHYASSFTAVGSPRISTISQASENDMGLETDSDDSHSQDRRRPADPAIPNFLRPATMTMASPSPQQQQVRQSSTSSGS